MLPGVFPSPRHLSADDASRENPLFLDRPAVPDLILAREIAPQPHPESVRIDGLAPRRRSTLGERLFDRPPS
ncbi:MAG TPA: hypothetical protein VJV23_10060 [Candidatus Polarisedimenticolia bacterium]|nr:hypothetical protein [Candidatus Polarisedimenticolia bacterium]